MICFQQRRHWPITWKNQIYILDLRRALEVIDSGRPLKDIANSNMKERSRDPEPAPAPVPEPEPEVSSTFRQILIWFLLTMCHTSSQLYRVINLVMWWFQGFFLKFPNPIVNFRTTFITLQKLNRHTVRENHPYDFSLLAKTWAKARTWARASEAWAWTRAKAPVTPSPRARAPQACLCETRLSQAHLGKARVLKAKKEKEELQPGRAGQEEERWRLEVDWVVELTYNMGLLQLSSSISWEWLPNQVCHSKGWKWANKTT